MARLVRRAWLPVHPRARQGRRRPARPGRADPAGPVPPRARRRGAQPGGRRGGAGGLARDARVVRAPGVLSTLCVALVAAVGLAVALGRAPGDQVTVDARATEPNAATADATGATIVAAAAGSDACRLGAPGTP